MDRYDIAIIGSGPAGYVGAIQAARAGAATCIIERDDFGGVCLNTGCIPTKTLIASSKLLRNIKRSDDFGITVQGRVDATADTIYQRKNKVIDIERKGLEKLVEESGVVIMRGTASFVDANTIKVSGNGDETSFSAKNVIIATGSKSAQLPFLPFDGVKVLSSEQLLGLETIPESLLIIGGGYIGCEFASFLAPLGTKVTIVEALPRLLMGVDEDIVTILAREFKKDKIDVYTNSQIVGAKVDEKVTVTLADGTDISSDIALVAVGRRPNSDTINIDTIGITTRHDHSIKVNDRMMTDVQGIYAVGDVIGKPMLAHVASAECKVAVANALGNKLIMDYTVVPAAIYTYPEIGSIGLTESQARDMGMDVKVGTIQLRNLGISHAAGDIAGMAKIVTDAISDTIVGIHIVAARATDIIHEVAVAMFQNMTSSLLSQVIHAHPTFSELVLEAAEDVHGNAIHVPSKRL